MTDLYAPNQQVVRADGSGPAEEGTGGSVPDPEPPPEPPPENGDGLEDMTKDELLAEAEARGIEANASMTKAQIIEALRAG
jgi:hypothetical protein